ncbi:MAG: carbohydrate-binding family 9-like protein [Gemmatimonadetes bacterium]|nr:carbohydrate-binding family 9-like protein [Gemmatimonadota bacterium]
MGLENNSEQPRRIVNFPMRGILPGRHVAVPLARENLDGLPPVSRYECRRSPEPIWVDGKLDEAVWQRVTWSESFVRIVTGDEASVETRVALLWDEQFLYVGYRVEDPDVRGTMGSYHDHIYMDDDDVEIFVEGDGYYYELGLNPINNFYELRWTWLENLVRDQRFAEIEQLLKLDDYLYYTAREGAQLGCVGDLNYHLKGLLTAVSIDGILNQSATADRGWTVEMALPWSSLQQVAGSRTFPPQAGDMLRMMGYRMRQARDAGPLSENEASTWGVVGSGNIHIPERWSEVVFSDEDA